MLNTAQVCAHLQPPQLQALLQPHPSQLLRVLKVKDAVGDEAGAKRGHEAAHGRPDGCSNADSAAGDGI